MSKPNRRLPPLTTDKTMRSPDLHGSLQSTGNARATADDLLSMSVTTFGDLFDAYLDDCRARNRSGDLKLSTLRGYITHRRVSRGLDAAEISSVRRAVIARWYRGLSQEPSRESGRRGKAMIHRANNALSFVRRAWDWGALLEIVPDENPAKKLPRARETPRERYLDEGECGRFCRAIKAARAKHLRWAEPRGAHVELATESLYSAILVLYLTGCRRREITTLTREDLRLGDLEIRLRDSKSGARIVPISAGARAELQRQLDRVAGRSPWVFPAADFARPADCLIAAWAHLREAAGFGSDVVIHTLRHTWACQALLADVPVEVVAKVLGHSSAAITERHYSHVLVTRAARAAAVSVGDALAALGELAA